MIALFIYVALAGPIGLRCWQETGDWSEVFQAITLGPIAIIASPIYTFLILVGVIELL